MLDRLRLLVEEVSTSACNNPRASLEGMDPVKCAGGADGQRKRSLRVTARENEFGHSELDRGRLDSFVFGGVAPSNKCGEAAFGDELAESCCEEGINPGGSRVLFGELEEVVPACSA